MPPLEVLSTETFFRAQKEQEVRERVSEILAGKVPQRLVVGEAEKKRLMQRLKKHDRPILASNGNGVPPP